MEIIVITVWFFALVAIAGAFAVRLVLRAVHDDDRYLATFEPR